MSDRTFTFHNERMITPSLFESPMYIDFKAKLEEKIIAYLKEAHRAYLENDEMGETPSPSGEIIFFDCTMEGQGTLVVAIDEGDASIQFVLGDVPWERHTNFPIKGFLGDPRFFDLDALAARAKCEVEEALAA